VPLHPHGDRVNVIARDAHLSGVAIIANPLEPGGNTVFIIGLQIRFRADVSGGKIPPGPPQEFMRAQLAIIYVVQKGKEAGAMLVPHRYRDGKYIASKCKQGPHLRVGSTEELLTHMVSGYSIHMSNPETRHHRAPRLIRPQSIRVEWVS
jgi:hypothetical protein